MKNMEKPVSKTKSQEAIMNIKLDVTLKDIVTGKNIEDKEGVVNLKKISLNACLLPSDKDKNEGGEKYKLYELAKKISESKDEIDLSIEEIAKIKERIGYFYGANVVGQAYDLFEGKK